MKHLFLCGRSCSVSLCMHMVQWWQGILGRGVLSLGEGTTLVVAPVSRWYTVPLSHGRRIQASSFYRVMHLCEF